jgi:hypothetical protein
MAREFITDKQRYRRAGALAAVAAGNLKAALDLLTPGTDEYAWAGVIRGALEEAQHAAKGLEREAAALGGL